MAMPGDTVRLGPYVLRRRLGEGGMGVVHLATAPDGSAVAVKELRPGVVAGDEGRERLAREVAALRRVRGLGIAEVLDADVAGPRPYIVTRFVDGRSLDRFVAEFGPLGSASQRRLATGLLESLACVHAAGVVHRDVKPGNVMLEDGGGVALIDFGLARAVDATRLTTTGILVGTPGYLAPETVVGRVPTTATDVHGWGATMAFAASGEAPYGDGPVVAVLDRIRRGEHSLRGLDPALEPLVRAALADDPRARPTLAQLGHALGPAARVVPAASGAVSAAASGAEAGRGEDTTAVLALSPRTRVDLAGPEDSFPLPPVGRVWSSGAPSPSGGSGATDAPPLPAPIRPTALVGAGGAVQPAAGAALPASGPPPGLSMPGLSMPGLSTPGEPTSSGALPPGPPGSGSSVVLPPWPGAGLEPRRATGASAVALLATAAVVVTGVAVAPYAALLALAVVLLVARTADRLHRVLVRRRLERGPRSHDVGGVVLQGPWRAVLALPGTLVQGVVVGVAAGLGAALAALLLSWPQASYYGAGLAAAATAWWGPGGGSTRRGARVLVGPLRSARGPGWTLVALLFVAAWLLALVADQYAAVWWPFASGPSLPALL